MQKLTHILQQLLLNKNTKQSLTVGFTTCSGVFQTANVNTRGECNFVCIEGWGKTQRQHLIVVRTVKMEPLQNRKKAKKTLVDYIKVHDSLHFYLPLHLITRLNVIVWTYFSILFGFDKIKYWSLRVGLNIRLTNYESDALPTAPHRPHRFEHDGRSESY